MEEQGTMTKGEIEKMVEDILDKTIKSLKYAYNHHKEDVYNSCDDDVTTRIIFPKKRDNEHRISEQEFRFSFLEHFLRDAPDNWYYSVETPTEEKYSFGKDDTMPLMIVTESENGNEDSKNKNKGESASIDFTIHDKNQNFERICLIEFKALNPNVKNFAKDFLKLNSEPSPNNNCIRYFCLLLKSANKGTYDSIRDKIFLTGEFSKKWDSDIKSKEREACKCKVPNIKFCAYLLEKGENVTNKIINDQQ